MKSIFRAAAVAAVTLACASAQAELVTFRVKGQVTYNNGSIADAPVGTPVVGHYTYDTSLAADYVFDYEDYDVAEYSIGSPASFKLRFGTHLLKAAASRAMVTDGVRNVQTDLFDFGSTPGVDMDGSFCEGCFFGFTLMASPDHANALKSVTLPASLNLKRFDREHIGYVITDSTQGYALQFSIDSIRPLLP